MRNATLKSRIEAGISVLLLGSSAIEGPAWLESYGVSTTPCVDSTEALEILGEGRHHAILYDLDMPGMSGELLLKNICADFPAVAAVAIAQPGELRLAMLAMIAGASGYIQSPLRPQTMVAGLQSALTKKQLDFAVRG